MTDSFPPGTSAAALLTSLPAPTGAVLDPDVLTASVPAGGKLPRQGQA